MRAAEKRDQREILDAVIRQTGSEQFGDDVGARRYLSDRVAVWYRARQILHAERADSGWLIHDDKLLAESLAEFCRYQTADIITGAAGSGGNDVANWPHRPIHIACRAFRLCLSVALGKERQDRADKSAAADK